MWTLLKHSRSRYLVVLHVRCSASKTLRVVLHLGGEEGQHWHNKHWRAHCYLQRDHLPVSKGKVTLKLVLELGFWIDCIAVLQHLNPGMTSRCTQRLFTCTARPSTTRFLRALSWGSFYFLTRWNLKLQHVVLIVDGFVHRTSVKCSSAWIWTHQSNRVRRVITTWFSLSCRLEWNPRIIRFKFIFNWNLCTFVKSLKIISCLGWEWDKKIWYANRRMNWS